jgi:carboxyl-terminal processing protease
VTLTVVNKKEKKPRKVTVTRAKIKIISVKSKMLEDGFGYIRIAAFQRSTAKKFKEAIKSLEKKSKGKMKGLIIDMRNNPGGLLDSAVKIVDSVLDSKKLGKNKKIVYTKGRVSQASKSFEATPGDMLKGVPIIVLLNEGSASGSEVVAGALKDHKRAIVVGKTSFGKGSVQTLLPVDEKTAVKITTSLYYTPKGTSIQAHGIKPDIVVENLKVAKDNEEELFFAKVKEKHLSGHLKNASKEAKSNYSYKQHVERAQEDYQLHEALIALKALAAVNQHIGFAS